MQSVGIYIGRYFHHWDDTSVANGIGGSETWAIEVAKELSKHYKVTMYADPQFDYQVNENLELVSYKNYLKDIEDGIEFDYFIFSREADKIHPHLKCSNVFVMVHDVVCSTSNGDIGLSRVKNYAYLSEWHKQNLLSAHKGLREESLVKVTNGFSRDEYDWYKDLQNHKTKSMVWSSSLTRGFFELYDSVLTEIIKQVPEFKIHVCCGTKWKIDVDLLLKASKLDNVIIHGTLSKNKLAQLQSSAKIWIYPGTFAETFCITAVENAYAGNCLIMPGSYGLKTTFEGYSEFEEIGYEPFKVEDKDRYIDLAVRALNDEPPTAHYIQETKHIAEQYSWERAAQDWINIFNNCDKIK